MLVAMTVCPFCKAPVKDAHGPCPRCGKLASDHPSIAAVGGRNLGSDFDDELGGDLDLGSGSVGGGGADASESYDGGGRTFDDDLLADGPQSGDLELDVPVKQSGEHRVPDLPPPSSQPDVRAAKSSGAHAAGAVSGAQLAAVRSGAGADSSSGALQSPGPSEPKLEPPPPVKPGVEVPKVDAAAAAIAKYPPPPGKAWHAPVYACKVLWRQLELRQDLESLRRRRSPDVPLYERALQAHDKRSFAIGLAVVCAALAITTVLFFMPVILRFATAPD